MDKKTVFEALRVQYVLMCQLQQRINRLVAISSYTKGDEINKINFHMTEAQAGIDGALTLIAIEQVVPQGEYDGNRRDYDAKIMETVEQLKKELKFYVETGVLEKEGW